MADQERNWDEESQAPGPAYYRQKTSADLALPARVDDDGSYQEETAAEIAAPVNLNRSRDYDRSDIREESGGKGIGLAALALSILSLFVLPILFGAAGIVLGFIARRRGASALGAWAIGLGAISIIVGMFIVPFF
ncbi:hypothetical protein [Pseudoneobacillus sp. C159]